METWMINLGVFVLCALALAGGWFLSDWHDEKKIKRLSDKWSREDSLKKTARSSDASV